MKIIEKVKNKYRKKNVLHEPKISYSQCGEDILIDYIFMLRGVQKPSYIDIGANDPLFLNNTAIFYLKGSKGINIEANPELLNSFKQNRKRDINLNIGVGSKKGILDFFVINDPTLSTFSKDECRNIVANGKYRITDTIKVKVTTIEEVITKYNDGVFPDFLSIDTEGMDLDILKTIDYANNFPKVICAEAAEYSPIGAGKRRDNLIDFLVSKGYYEYANTNLNAIMVKKEFWFI